MVGIILLLISGILTGGAWLLYRYRKEISKYIKRKRIEWFPLQQTITFSVKHNEELNSGNYYEEIKKVFIGNIKKYNLTKSISYRDCSGIYMFGDVQQAIEFRNKKNLDLILWGEFSNDHLKRNGEHESEITLNFTYGFKHGDNNKEAVESDIQKRIQQIMLIKNNWKIRENNSLEDVGKVADGIFTVSVFVLALTLTNQHRFQEAENIFDKLSTYLNDRSDATAINLNEYLATCNYYLLHMVMTKKKVDWVQANKISNKILKVSPDDLDGLIIAAISFYKIGDMPSSESISSRLMTSYPRSGAARINFAFIHILKGNYGHALRHYNKVFSDSNIDFDVMPTIDILNQEYERTKEPALRYASGVLSLNLMGDSVLAEKDLREFLKLGNVEKHGVMYRDAQRILISLHAHT